MQENSNRKEIEMALTLSLQKSEPEVLARLYDAYAPVLLGLISRIVRNSQTAELVLQETFLAIWQQRATYQAAQGGLLTWMIMMAKERALAVLQSGKDTSKPQNLATEAANRQEEARIQKLFQQLNANEKAVLDLIYLKGCSSAEAAQTLGITEENLKITLRQAITHLRANNP